MTHQDVRPLFEDPSAPAELRNFAALARSDGPSQADLERLAGRVGRAVGVPAGVLLAGSAASAGALGTPPAELGAAHSGAAQLGALGKLFGSSGGKLLAVGLAAGIGVGVWAYARPHAARDTRARLEQSAPVRALPAEAEPQPPASPTGQRRVVPAERAARGAAPSPVVTPLATEPQRAAPARVGAARPSSRRGPAAQVTAPVKQEPDAIEPEAPPAAPPPAPELPSELNLIQRAEAARHHGAQALELLATHERLYPRGALAQEREVLAIELLFKIGESQRARERAVRFERSHPSSAHLPRLRALLERAGQ